MSGIPMLYHIKIKNSAQFVFILICNPKIAVKQSVITIISSLCRCKLECLTHLFKYSRYYQEYIIIGWEGECLTSVDTPKSLRSDLTQSFIATKGDK